MLEHQKMILRAVSDNEELFKKEVIKALTWLKPREKSIFRKWLRKNYLQQYPDLVELSESPIEGFAS